MDNSVLYQAFHGGHNMVWWIFYWDVFNQTGIVNFHVYMNQGEI